jgi:SAM-dependent methyltransferase
MSDGVIEKVAAHYGRGDFRGRVAEVLEKAGKRAGNTSVEELAGLDQWHPSGLVPTRRLAKLAEITPADTVLDAGCGMGGPARWLAKEHGCFVHGIDIADQFLQTAELFNEATGMASKVSLQRGDVTAMPFGDNTFDVVWTQNALQNIPAKDRFYSEAARVLKPGGRFVMQDLYLGLGVPVHFPSFWGEDDSISFLVSNVEIQDLLRGAGFDIANWNDTTEESHRANSAMDAQNAKSELVEPTIDGLDIVLMFGDLTTEMASNSVRDMEVGSVGIFEAFCTLPS